MPFLCVVRTSCLKSFAKSNTLISSSQSVLRFGFIGRCFKEQRPFSGTAATSRGWKNSPPGQSVSPLAPIGINAALQAATDPSITPKPKIFEEFALSDRVGIVSGGNRGLGLEMALALCEAGARAIYCFDLPTKPSDEWTKTQEYVKRMQNGSRLEYVSVDVRDQQVVWREAQEIGDQEKRMDICVAAAGILKSHTDCLTYPAEQFKEVGGFVFFAFETQLMVLVRRSWTLTQMVSCIRRKQLDNRCFGSAIEVASSSSLPCREASRTK
jgi:hypothetical protein